MTDINKLKKDKKENEEEQKYDPSDNIGVDQTDGEFIKSFENRTFKSWKGHESFLRKWCTLFKIYTLKIISRK